MGTVMHDSQLQHTEAEQLRAQEQALAKEIGVDIPTARQILANRQLQDTRIIQKINHAHRDAFATKFPGQVEHCLRLVMERLQWGLDKRGQFDISNTDTWILDPQEICSLAQAAEKLHSIRKDL